MRQCDGVATDVQFIWLITPVRLVYYSNGLIIHIFSIPFFLNQ
jgi:hypothetical protein